MNKKKGFNIFLLVVISQTISLVGSSLSDFALAFWVLDGLFVDGGSLIAFSMIYFFVYFPGMLVSPFAGTIIDQTNKKIILIASNCVAALATIFTLIMVLQGTLEVWHIYLAASIKSVAATFLIPSFQACMTLLVDKDDYGKAYGFAQMGESLHRVISPAVAGVLFSIISIKGILYIDLVCFVIGVSTLLFIKIPEKIIKKLKEKLSFWQETIEGYKLFLRDRGLVNLLIFFVISNFLLGFVQVWVQPLVYNLAQSQVVDQATALGIVLTAGGIGMMAGSIVMGITGGPKNKVRGIMTFTFLGGVVILAAVITNSLIIFTLGAMLYFLTIPFVLGCNLAIWQGRVEAEYQGRIFSLRRSAVLGALPLSFILAGVIGDWTQPMFQEGGVLANSIGGLLGTGSNKNYSFLFSSIGFFSILLSIFGFFNKSLRRVEKEEVEKIQEEVKMPLSKG